jgi:putative endonuclease
LECHPEAAGFSPRAEGPAFQTVKDLPIYAVYIMASKSRRLYVGITSQLRARVWKHKTGHYSSFTKVYRISRLVYYELFPSVDAAIAREKQLKGWKRHRKIELIRHENPTWEDLSQEWGEPFTSLELEKQVLRCAQDDTSTSIPLAKAKWQRGVVK